MNKKPWTILLLLVLLYAGCAGIGNTQTERTTARSNEASSTTSYPDSSTASTVSSTTTTELPSTSSTAEPIATTSTTPSTTIHPTTTSTTSSTTTTAEGIKVEVVYFYPVGACENCKEVGQLTEETIDTYYLEEQADGKLVYKVAYLADPESRALIKKYGAATASVWIGTYVNGTFYRELKGAVWYKTGDPAEFKRYLKESIDKDLKGDVS